MHFRPAPAHAGRWPGPRKPRGGGWANPVTSAFFFHGHKEEERAMKKFLSKMPDALVRLLVVFLGLIFVGAFVVIVLIPKPMKDVKIQWADAVKREQAMPVQYAGFHACAECHDKIYEKKKTGYHKDLSCETCHGPAKAHTQDPDKFKPAIPKERSFCPLCHGEIARTKAVSHHVQLECTVCHQALQQHKISPRSVKPTKPQNREFCGKCHAKDAKDKLARNAPKVDLSTHGEKYVCWQCHYPHSPEVEE